MFELRQADDEDSRPIASRATATLIKLTVLPYSAMALADRCQEDILPKLCLYAVVPRARSKRCLSQLIGIFIVVRLRDTVEARKKRRPEEKKKGSVLVQDEDRGIV